jgi:hypothetical protein
MKTAEKLVRLNVNSAGACSLDEEEAAAAGIGAKLEAAEEARDSAHQAGGTEPGNVLQMFKEASRRNWGMADEHNEEEENGEAYDSDVDLSMSGSGED